LYGDGGFSDCLHPRLDGGLHERISALTTVVGSRRNFVEPPCMSEPSAPVMLRRRADAGANGPLGSRASDPNDDLQEGCIMDFKLELVLLPVSDVDRAKTFYVERAGFHLDVDHQLNEEFRIVQMTPPGSACSVTIGRGITDAAPGSVRGTHLIVTDIEAARAELVGRGVEVSEIKHFESGQWVAGPDPERRDYGSFADFSDPDGNTWVLQEVRRGKTEA
jgi:catechol 2,3-dioxygenase-like lactoylglutathione lyase family enzyme